jgi:hypothetical protein
MRSRRWWPATLALLSFFLAALFSVLANLTSTYLADTLRPYATWVYALTGLVFFVSVAVLIGQLLAANRAPTAPDGPRGPQVEMKNVRAGGDVHVVVAGGDIVQGGSPAGRAPVQEAVPDAAAADQSDGELAREQAAILRGFTREELRQVLRTGMELDLDTIVRDGPFGEQVFAVLTWSVRTGRHGELLACLRRARPRLGV